MRRADGRYTGHKVNENPQLYLTAEELKNIERNKRVRPKFEAAVIAEEERQKRPLLSVEKAEIQKRLLAEEP